MLDIECKRIPRSVLYAALYTFAAHYHSGQWSRGYRLLCRTGRAWKRHAGIEPRLDFWEWQLERETGMLGRNRSDLVNLYLLLVERYGGKV